MPRERNNNPDLRDAPQFPVERPRTQVALRDYMPGDIIRSSSELAAIYLRDGGWDTLTPVPTPAPEPCDPVDIPRRIHRAEIQPRAMTTRGPSYCEMLHDGVDHVLVDESDIAQGVREYNRMYRPGWDAVADGCCHHVCRDKKVEDRHLWGAVCAGCGKIEIRFGMDGHEYIENQSNCPFCATSNLCSACGCKMRDGELVDLALEVTLESMRQEIRRLREADRADAYTFANDLTTYVSIHPAMTRNWTLRESVLNSTASMSGTTIEWSGR